MVTQSGLESTAKNASKNDIDVLKRAVRNIGRDIGAVIPDAMAIEIVEGVKAGGKTDHFEKLAAWVDNQLSKGILGQTATTEGTPGKLGSEDAQQEVRRDLKEADARQLETTLNRDLVIPYITLNFGTQEQYPKLRLPVPRPEDINGLVDNVAKLVPLGLPVKRSELYAKLGLTEPGKDDAVLVGESAPVNPDAAGSTEPNAERSAAAMNAAAADPDELEAIVEATEWEPHVKPLHEAVTELSAECKSYEEFERRLPELLARIDTAGLTRALALDMFKARALGDAEFQADE